MKILRVLIFGLLASAVASQAQISSPGWFRPTSRTVTPQPRPDQTQEFQARASSQMASLAQAQPSSPVAEVITPQIQALADGLQHNPVRIFDYVHDNIKFVPYFGAKKGAQLTLLEKSGNDFDQCALMTALLRAAGYTNLQYQFGWQEIPYDDPYGYDYDLRHWWRLTLNNTNWANTVNYVVDLAGFRGYPRMYYDDLPSDAINGYTNNFLIQRTWVALTIGASTYQLDPAFKISEQVSGISLTGAMGGSGTTLSNALISAAAGTDNVNYAQNLSEAAIRSKLTSYATNLYNYIQSSAPNARTQDILGGWQIVPAYNPWDFSTYNLFYVVDPTGSMPVVSWTYLPTNMMSTLRITFAGTNYQCFMPQLQGQRLALTFDASATAQLWLDDTMVQQGNAGGGSNNNVVLFAHHPSGSWDDTNNVYIDGTYNDQISTNVYQSTNATYALMYAFEPDWGWLQQRQKMLDVYLQQGLSNSSRQVASESLNIMGLNWMLQTAQMEEMLAAQLGILPMHFHRIGRMGQESGHGYYVDVYMQMTGEYPGGGDDAAHLQLANSHFDLWSFFASAMEHGVIEQFQNTNLVAASTVKMLQIANTNGQAVYLASSANWSSIQGNLLNYGDALNWIYNQFISQGYSVLLPANGSNHVTAASGTWAGYGFEARLVMNGQSSESQMIIAGGYHGGYPADTNTPVNPTFIQTTYNGQPYAFSGCPLLTPLPTIGDPVDSADATFTVQHTDISLGQAEPRGITLSRYYNGTRRNSNPSGMSGGWLHNYSISAYNVAAPQAGLGCSTPAQAASMLAATASAVATYNGSIPNAKNWLTTALIAKWGVDQIIKNGASVSLGKDTLQFVKQPDGTFTPPANCSATLTQTNSAFSLQMRHGNCFNFNAAGLLTNIVDQYSNTLTLVYTNNFVKTVTDWKNRTLTFNYTGSQLTSVSDNSTPSRTVYYGYSTAYNSQGDLTTFTDAEGKPTTYVYDTNHQITATLDALSRLVVSNVYDGQGHITTQFTQGDTNKAWHIYWSGRQTTEFDPANGETDYFFDEFGRLTAVVDPLQHETDTFYDGQNHIIATVSPLGETNRFVYDGNNNLLQTIDPLGYTNQFIYDPANNNLIRSIDQRGNPTTFGYNAQFSVTGQTNGAGDWVNYEYNSDGTLHTRTDTGGTTTFDSYDSYGQLTHITYPNGLGGESFVNNLRGDTTTHTDGNGNPTTFQYNARRQLTNTIAPTNVTVKVGIDDVGNVGTITDPRNNVINNTWSPTRHLLKTALPATPQGAPSVTNIYDSRDWLTKTLDPYQQSTSYTNDAAGRLTSVTDRAQRTSRFSYDADGRNLTAANAANETNSQTWDARGSLKKLTDGAGHFSSRVYDAAGNQTILTNRNGKKWQFKFDGANRLTNTITPLNRSSSLTFNHQGLVATAKDPANQPTSFYYDGKGRLTNRTDNIGTTYFGYDANDNRTSVTENGLTNSWTFNAYNRVSTYTDVYGNLIQYRYDGSGNLTNLVYPGNKNVYYAYDSLNRLTNVTDWAQRKTSIGYDLNSHITSIVRPNGTYRTVGFDAAGQATNILEQMGNTLPIAWFKFNWTNTGNMAWEFAAPMPHSNSVPTRTMTYDDDNRLATVNGTSVVNDDDGNLTYAPLTNGTFVAQVFDARNRLTSSAGVTNGYDPINNRISQTVGTNTTLFVVNPNAKLPQVLMRIKNGVTNYYIYGAGLLYQITETATATNTLTYHFDYRGSTIALTDDTGKPTDRVEYSAYGLTTYRAGTNDTPFQFNGRYGVQTDQNGLLYMRARYYNPYLCCFVSADPSGFGGGLNFYAYAGGNPISYLDPLGLVRWGDLGVATLGLVGNGLGEIAGGALALAPEPTMATKVAAGVVIAKSSYGLGANAQNFWAALIDKQPVSTGNLANDVATVIAPGNQNAQHIATAFDIATDLGTAGVGITHGLAVASEREGGLLAQEIGNKTFAGAIPEGFAAIDDVAARGQAIIAQQGIFGAMIPEGSGWFLGIGKTFATGPTPAALMGVTGFSAFFDIGYQGILDYSQPFLTMPSNNDSTGK